MSSTSGIRWQEALVLATEDVAERIVRLTLRPQNPQPVSPGMHLKVLARTGQGLVERSYSIVDAAPDGSEVALSVFETPTSRGGSQFMHTLVAGDVLQVSQPMQDFPLRIGAPHYILVAGGIGITAIRNMAALLKRLGADYEIHFAARSPEAMAYREEMARDHGDRLATYLDSEGTYLDVPALLDTVRPGTELYMCGPIRLMDAIRREWNARGYDPTSLRFETFGNSGWFEAQKFQVEIPKLGVSTEIGENESLLDALQKAGLEMMYDCRRGECGLCQVTLVDVDGEVDHRDVFLSDRQKEAKDRMCACVSRAATGSDNHDKQPALITIDIP